MSAPGKPIRKFRYEIISRDGDKLTTASMRQAARLAVTANGICRVLLLGDRDHVVGQHEFKTGPLVVINDEGLRFARAKLKDEDRWDA